MKRFNISIKKIFSDEKGIALLFTLGILSLLLVLAMAFVSNSILEQKMSINSDAKTSAQLLAKSALNRAIGSMVFYSIQYPNADFSSITSYNTTDSMSPKTFDYIYKLNTSVDNQSYYDQIKNDFNYNTTGVPHWIYIRDGQTGTDSDQIIGRIAYIVTADKGKLDPSATATAAEATYPKQRLGNSVNEISLVDLDLSGGISSTEGTYKEGSYMTAARAAALYNSGTRWTNIENIFSSLSIPANQQDTFKNWLIVNNPPDPEAFWIDVNGNGIKESAELYHRFNLTRTDWDTMPVSTLIAAPAKYTDSFSTTSGIPWLQNWVDAGSMVDATACKNQIAANIIDYCDINSYATTDYNATDPTVTTYVGLEKSPYINEAGITANGSVSETPTGSGVPATAAKYTIAVTADLSVELVNLYENSVNANAYVTIAGSYKWKPGPAGTETLVTFAKTNQKVTINVGAYNYDKNTLSGIDISPAAGQTEYIAAAGLTMSISEFTITKFYITLSDTAAAPDAAHVMDFSNIENTTPLNDLYGGSGTGALYFNYQVNDPRQNTRVEDWTPGRVIATVAPANNFGSKNTVCAPNTATNHSDDKDYDSAASDLITTGTACNVATAFIRNAPMKSPWELGCIHRGKAWQTLRLAKYNTVATGADAGVKPSTYTDGDANILDMVKMTSDLSTYGKVNINTSNVDILRALFTNIKIDSATTPLGAYNTPGAPAAGNLITQDFAEKLGKSDLITGTMYGVMKYTPFSRRSEIAKVLALSTSIALTPPNASANTVSKRQEDETIGKVVNLLKAESVNEFSVIAVAQVIKDVGETTATNTQKDINQDGTLGSVALNSTATFPAPSYYTFVHPTTGSEVAFATVPGTVDETTISVRKGRYDLGMDEILAESKILAIVYYDPTSTTKFKIKKLQFLSQ